MLCSFPGGSPEDERLDQFSNVVTNSGGGIIGGSCTGGFAVLCLLFYILYKWLKDQDHPETPVHSTHITQPDAVTNRNRAPCQCGRNVPSTPPPLYDEVMEEFAEPPGVCMSVPPPDSKQSTIWPNK